MIARPLALFSALLLATAGLSTVAYSQAPPPKTEKAQPKDEKQSQKDAKAPAKEDKPAAKDDKAPKKDEKAVKLPPDVVTDGSVIIAGQKVEYRATAGMLPSVDKTGKAKAHIFYVAYMRKTGESQSSRRLTFCFNGGPGSASAYVHLGFFGPRRVLINDDGLGAPRPVQMIENDCSLLDVTDLVFIDPVSTGLSRPENPSEAVLFHGLEEDTQSVGDFVRDYVAKFDRKESPVYVAGESYGTTRAASLSSYIQGKGGVKLAGIVLISAVLDFQTIRFGTGNDLPYALHLPTYTATAFHHGKLDKKWATDLQTAIRESQKFADGPYLEVLHKGNLLSDYEREAAAKQIAMLTGLSEEFVLRTDLRIEATRFRNELLRDKQMLVGRLDTRVTAKYGQGAATVASADGRANGSSGSSSSSTTNGTPPASPSASSSPVPSDRVARNGSGNGANRSGGSGSPATAANGENPGRGPANRGGRGFGGGDPSNTLVSNIFSDAMKVYLTDTLGYKTDARYTLTAQVQPWSFGQAGNNRYADVAPRLRSALEKDKSLRVFVAAGYCDLATPFAGINYTFAHIGPRSLMDQVTMAYYDAGHMLYTHEPSRRKLRDDLVKFMTSAAASEKK
jgi:carboxypeptidase C (cathepsin A)